MRHCYSFFSILLSGIIISISACSGSKSLPLPSPTPSPNVPETLEEDRSLPPLELSTVLDPDNLKVYFRKPASEVYRTEFTGVARAEAKTHPSAKITRQYKTVGDVLKNLPTDSYMRRIGVGDNTPRTPDEDYNVFIEKAYIFYISEEDDQDYHLIIGDINENGEKSNFMTAEIAGLPIGENNTLAYQLLERTRRQLYEKYPDFFVGKRKTYKPTSKFPVIALRGTLFFDNRHTAGQIGAGIAKPNTVWEIHPVTFIDFK
jgi:hypothetical protein